MNILEADETLAAVYGRRSETWQCTDPLDELIESILNQRTTNAHAARAMRNLRGQGAPWAAVASLPYDVLCDLVRPAGLARQKAARIQEILERLHAEAGDYTLDFLREMESRAATKFLCSLPGVGVHTAALVLLFALGRPGVMPVDGHVHRVARRLGWAPHDAGVGAVQRAIEAAAPERNLLDLHVNLIRIGRQHCSESAPDCPQCPLAHQCAAARRQGWW